MSASNKQITYFCTTIIIIVLGVLLVNCSKSYATRELRGTTLNNAKMSENIVVARCISSESKWNKEGSLIFTYVNFQIEDTVKGDNSNDTLTLRLIGGQVGDQILSAPDLPNISEDEEVILFLGPKNNAGYPTLTSARNGVLRIYDDGLSGKKIVVTPTTGIPIYKENTISAITQPKDGEILLIDFIYSLKKAINN